MKVPRVSLFQKGNINSEYTNHADHNKNSYLSYNNGFIEDSMYSKWGVKSRQIFDCYSVFSSELIYESLNLENCSNCVHVYYSKDCLDCGFLYNCRGCNHCFLSSNLRNKSYVFLNKQLSKEEYQKAISEINIGSFTDYKNTLEKFKNEVLKKTIRKYAIIEKTTNVTGNNIIEAKNIKDSFHISKAEDCAFCVDDSGIKDSYDAYEAAFNCELQYDCHACNRLSNGKFCSVSYDSHDIIYCEMCYGSSNLFGCIGIRNKSYCILNKQYSKEAYEQLVSKIIQQMQNVPYIDKKQRSYFYGEFFPNELSPFSYNETVAQEYFPLSKNEALQQGYSWQDSEIRNYNLDISTDKIPDHIKDVDDTIAGKVIECIHKGKCKEQCTEAFKVLVDELSFYRRMNIPIPRLCPNCRHYDRIKYQNPMKLWHRTCMCEKKHAHHKEHCDIEFETPYAPNQSEIVYCEKCYQQEVY